MHTGTLQIDRIQGELKTQRVGRHVEFLPTTPSTSDEAWQRIDAHEADGLVVLTDHQSAGRGRFGRVWESPRGAGLLCSVALLDPGDLLTGPELCLLGAVAVCDAIKATTDVVPVIKWPNDLLVSGRKIGGILVESRVRRDGVVAYVMGIGINCLQQRGHLSGDLAAKATSLELESRHAIDRTALAIALFSELDRWVAHPQAWDYSQLSGEWQARAEPMGRRVRVRHRGRLYSGTVIDLDPVAALVVQLDEGGIRAFNAGDTTILDWESAVGG